MQTNSPLASLAARTTSQAATAPKNESPQQQVTGQWLYDRFIVNDGESITKMGIVREMFPRVDVASFKTALRDMVEMADKDEKESGKVGRKKTAQNAASVMKLAYGALRFAGQALESLGYTERTGYQDMRIMAKRALDDVKLKWDGSPVLNDELRAKRTREKTRRDEIKAMKDLMESNIRGDEEDLVAYQTRIAGMVQEKLNEVTSEKADEQLNKVASAIIKEYGADVSRLIAERILLTLQNTEEVQDEDEVETV